MADTPKADLPELPVPRGVAEIDVGYDIQACGQLIQYVDAYTADQMHDYAEAYAQARITALQAELERVRADEREKLATLMLESAEHAVKNGEAVGKYAGCEDEGRARILSACHLREFAELLHSQNLLEHTRNWCRDIDAQIALIRSGGGD